MAPTRITRSAGRKNGITFHTLDAGVHKTFQCIICDKKHGSRAALSRHFKSHPTRPEELSPFAHPSCWDEKPLTGWPLSGKGISESTVDSDVFDALSSKKQRAIDANITYARAGVKNKKQLLQQEDQTRLRLLHWWFGTNEEALRARMKLGPKGLFPRQEKRKLQDRFQEFCVTAITAEDDSLIEATDAPPISQVEPLSAAKAPTTQADHLVSNPDQAADSVSCFEHDFDRSLSGSVIADFELSSARPLTSLPLLWCMSNTFTHFIKTRGEDLVCAVALKRATEAYLNNVGVSQDLRDKLNSRFDYRIMRKYGSLAQCDEEKKMAVRRGNERRFRKDRAFVWDVLEQATDDYFNDYNNCEPPVALAARHSSDAVKVIIKATRRFVTVLGDAQTPAYMRKYWVGKI